MCRRYNRLPMLWLKALHIVFLVTWFAGLFYLPRLFVYHVATTDAPGRARFIVMERRLFAIMSIGALCTVLLGTAMIITAPALLATTWMHVKLPLVALLVIYHAWVYRLMLALRSGGEQPGIFGERLFDRFGAFAIDRERAQLGEFVDGLDRGVDVLLERLACGLVVRRVEAPIGDLDQQHRTGEGVGHLGQAQIVAQRINEILKRAA